MHHQHKISLKAKEEQVTTFNIVFAMSLNVVKGLRVRGMRHGIGHWSSKRLNDEGEIRCDNSTFIVEVIRFFLNDTCDWLVDSKEL